MKAEYNILNPKFFIKHSENMASFLSEGMMEFSDKIRLVGFDPSRICVLELKMGSDVVKTDNKHKLEAPIDLSDFSKIIKRFSNPENLTIIYNNTTNIVTIKGKIKNRTKTFNISTIEMDNSEFIDPIPNLSKIPYNAIFKVLGSDLFDAIQDAEIFAEIFTISTKDNNVLISARGNVGNCKIEIETESEIYSKDISSYSIHFFKDMLKQSKNSDILIMFKTDYPLALFDKLSDKSHMLYYLAPRVETEDEPEDDF